MIELLEDITHEDLPSRLGSVFVLEFLVDTAKLKYIRRVIGNKSDEVLGICLYFSEDISSPDIIINLMEAEDLTGEEVIKELENCKRRNNMKIVKF